MILQSYQQKVMENYTLTAATVIPLVVGISFTLRYLASPTPRYPPGPKRYPLIGSLYALPSGRKDNVFAQWGKEYKSDARRWPIQMKT